MTGDLIKLNFFNETDDNTSGVDIDRTLPFARSALYRTSIGDYSKLTQGDDVKTVYKITLDLPEEHPEFLPGDTIGIVPKNPENLVDNLLIRLNLESVASKLCTIQISSTTTKKNPQLPKHLPIKSTIRDILQNCVDIRTPPKKFFLKSLIKFTKDPQEVEELQQICSPKGSQGYTELITGPGGSLLGLLNKFPSCEPCVEVILENLPPLLPRPYSIASSPQSPTKFDVVFVVVERDDGTKGLCSGWLENAITTNLEIAFYFRQSNNFRIPPDISMPLILICAGTGVAPFRGFVQHRFFARHSSKIWLIYGCRYPDRDFLFKDEFQQYLHDGYLAKFDVNFSRISDKSYVQDSIEKNGKEFVDWILNKNAIIFVCGDLNGMVKDVRKAIINNFVNYNSLNCDEADDLLTNLQQTNRYIVDNWV